MSDNSDDSRSIERDSSPMPEIRSTLRPKGDNRTPIKHLLIGTPQIVEFTTRRLDQLGYAEAIDLTEPLNLVPDPGDVIRLLVRYLRIS